MKRILLLVLVISVFGIQQIFAQCSMCTPVFNTCPPSGGLCNRLDTAYANHPYDKQLNFFMPQLLTDPSVLALCQCSSVNLRHITVAGVSGLPGGITYAISNGSYFDVAGGDSIGCAHFCGTALVPGVYVISVHLYADVTAHGTPIGDVNQDNVAQQYFDTLWVLPDTVAGVTSFTYGNNGSSACDSITVDLHATRTAQLPNMTRWYWNIDGTSYEGKDPGVYRFTNTTSVPDTFDIILNTVFYQYTVKSISIYGIDHGWYTDWNEASAIQDPEPYMVVGALGTTNDCSNSAPSTTTPSWSNLNYPVPFGTTALTMELWDDDLCGNTSTTIALFGLADDDLETMTCSVALGLQVLAGNTNNANGNVRFDTIPGIVLSDTLHVIVNPTPVTPVILAGADTICSTDSTRLSIGAGYPGCNFEWYRDSIYINGVNDSALYTNLAGKYKVKVTNQTTGCVAESDWKSVVRIQSPPATINVVFNGTSTFVSPFPAGLAVDWFYNGSLVVGQHGKFLAYLGNGIYTAEVYSVAYPSCRTVANPDTVNVTGYDEITFNSAYNLNVYPNPNNGKFTLKFTTEETQNIRLHLEDMIGQTVLDKPILNFSGDYTEELDLTSLNKGVYFIVLETPKGRLNSKVVIH